MSQSTIPAYVTTSETAQNQVRKESWRRVASLPPPGSSLDENILRKRNEVALARAHDEIAKSETELRTIIDAIPQLIIAIGCDGNSLHANERTEEPDRPFSEHAFA
jgi:PAS domain-containing protein